MRKSLLIALILLLGPAVCSVQVLADNVTWPKAGQGTSPTTLTAPHVVKNGDILTINPGHTVLMSKEGKIVVQAGGQLVARGTEKNPIVIKAANPAAGQGPLTLIDIQGGAAPAPVKSTLTWCRASGAEMANIRIQGDFARVASPEISNCDIFFSKVGIEINGNAKPTIRKNRIHHNIWGVHYVNGAGGTLEENLIYCNKRWIQAVPVTQTALVQVKISVSYAAALPAGVQALFDAAMGKLKSEDSGGKYTFTAGRLLKARSVTVKGDSRVAEEVWLLWFQPKALPPPHGIGDLKGDGKRGNDTWRYGLDSSYQAPGTENGIHVFSKSSPEIRRNLILDSDWGIEVGHESNPVIEENLIVQVNKAVYLFDDSLPMASISKPIIKNNFILSYHDDVVRYHKANNIETTKPPLRAQSLGITQPASCTFKELDDASFGVIGVPASIPGDDGKKPSEVWADAYKKVVPVTVPEFHLQRHDNKPEKYYNAAKGKGPASIQPKPSAILKKSGKTHVTENVQGQGS